MRPKWFYWLVAVCLGAITVALVLRLRWQTVGNEVMLDTWRHRLCTARACIPFARLTVTPSVSQPAP